MTDRAMFVVLSHSAAGERAEGPFTEERAFMRRSEIWDAVPPGESVPVSVVPWVISDEDRERGWTGAALEVYRRWDRYREVCTTAAQLCAMIELDEAVLCLATWLPGYDVEQGALVEDA